MMNVKIKLIKEMNIKEMNVEELFNNEKWIGYGLLTTDDANATIDYLKTEVIEYVVELEKELIEEARLNGMGAEREAKLLAKIAELERTVNMTYSIQTKQAERIAELEADKRELVDFVRNVMLINDMEHNSRYILLKRFGGGA